MRAKVLFASLIVCLFAFTASPALADDKSDAGAFADKLSHEAFAILTDKSQSVDEKRVKLEGLFQQNVDIKWIGQFVLGRFWREATDEQKQQYIQNYQQFILKHYTSNLNEFSNANFEVAKIAPDEQNGFDVTVRVKRPGAEDTIVDYVVRKKGGDFMVYDMVIEGVSMITTQRSEFSSVVSQKGLDYLIVQLKQRSMTDAQTTATDTQQQ